MNLAKNYKVLYTDRSKPSPVSAKKEVAGVKSDVVAYLVKEDGSSVVRSDYNFLFSNGEYLMARKNGVSFKVALRDSSATGDIILGKF